MQNATSNVMRFEHPERGRRAWFTPTRREQLQAKHEIAALLGSAPCRRDMLNASTCSLGQAGSDLLTCLAKCFPHLLTA